MGLFRFSEPPIVGAAKTILSEVKDNLQAIENNTQTRADAWTALKTSGSLDIFKDGHRTDLALDATYAALRTYAGYRSTTGASPELVAAAQVDAVSRLTGLRHRLELIINAN